MVSSAGRAAKGSYFACGGKMRQSLVAVRTLIFYCRKWFFFTAAGDCCFCVAGAAFQGLIACGGKIAFLFSIACGGKKSIACGGKWVSLMPGYIKPIACGSKLLCSTCAHTCLLFMWFLHIHWNHCNADRRLMLTSFRCTGFHCFYWCLDWSLDHVCILFRGSNKEGWSNFFRGLFDSVTIGKTYGFWCFW